jgi:hypothetical protein
VPYNSYYRYYPAPVQNKLVDEGDPPDLRSTDVNHYHLPALTRAIPRHTLSLLLII